MQRHLKCSANPKRRARGGLQCQNPEHELSEKRGRKPLPLETPPLKDTLSPYHNQEPRGCHPRANIPLPLLGSFPSHALPATSTMSPGTMSRARIRCTPLRSARITFPISGSYSFRASMALSAFLSCRWRSRAEAVGLSKSWVHPNPIPSFSAHLLGPVLPHPQPLLFALR